MTACYKKNLDFSKIFFSNNLKKVILKIKKGYAER